MHILQIYKDYFPVLGGIENHLKALAEGLVERGHQVTVLVTSLNRRDEVTQNDGLTVIKAGRLLHTASTPLSVAMLAHARHLRPDVVNLHFPYPPGDMIYRALPERPPLVVTYHSDIVRQRGLLHLYRPQLIWTLDHAARIIATSMPYVASSSWLASRAACCTVVPLSVDAARFAAPDAAKVAALRERYGAPLLLFVGRLRYYKGLHVLLDALPQIDARLLLVGTGPEEARLRAQAGSLGLSEQVHFAGDVSDADLPAFYAAADMYVLPAHLRAEAFGISQLEAMASGLPVVSTELGTGTSYANQHGVTGFVVSPSSPDALVRAVRVLLANPELRARMGAAAKARVAREFTHERMVAATEEVYQSAGRRLKDER